MQQTSEERTTGHQPLRLVTHDPANTPAKFFLVRLCNQVEEKNHTVFIRMRAAICAGVQLELATAVVMASEKQANKFRFALSFFSLMRCMTVHKRSGSKS